MAEPEVHITDAPTASDLARIDAALDEFNVRETGIDDRRPLAVLVKDPVTGQVLGGMSGHTSLGLLFVESFHIPGTLRGSGIGTAVLQAAEDEGRRRGCRNAVLYTLSFQAPGFYEKEGWQVFGDVPCEPPGTSRVFMTKSLT